jgi:hypothetical protein
MAGSATFSAAVSVGTRLKLWNTNPMLEARILVRTFSDIPVTSLPLMVRVAGGSRS